MRQYFQPLQRTVTDTRSGYKVNVGVSFFRFLFGKASYKNQNTTTTHTEVLVEPYETKQEDVGVKAHLLTESNRLKLVEENLNELLEMQQQFTAESETIVDAAAKFMKFVIENAAASFEDAFQQYIKLILEE